MFGQVQRAGDVEYSNKISEMFAKLGLQKIVLNFHESENLGIDISFREWMEVEGSAIGRFSVV